MNASADAEFTEFMHGRWTQLVRLGYGLTGDQQLAEDLAQTALIKAYASWARVRRTGNPDAYVRRIMLNANHRRFRKRRVAERLTDTLPDGGGGDPMGLRDDRSVLITALMTLPYGQRAAVVLRYWMDMTETEAAAVLGCSVGNVKSQASRALAKLRLTDGLTDGISTHGISTHGISTRAVNADGSARTATPNAHTTSAPRGPGLGGTAPRG